MNLTDQALAIKIAALLGLDAYFYVDENNNKRLATMKHDDFDPCNNWSDLMPLVEEYCLKCQTFNRHSSNKGVHQLVRMVSKDNSESFVTNAKTLQRALAECLYKVLQAKAEKE